MTRQLSIEEVDFIHYAIAASERGIVVKGWYPPHPPTPEELEDLFRPTEGGEV